MFPIMGSKLFIRSIHAHFVHSISNSAVDHFDIDFDQCTYLYQLFDDEIARCCSTSHYRYYRVLNTSQFSIRYNVTDSRTRDRMEYERNLYKANRPILALQEENEKHPVQ